MENDKRFYIAEMGGITNNLIKQVAVAKKGLDSYN